MNNNQRQPNHQLPITKQQLFVNPITLLQKQIVPSQNHSPPPQTSHHNEFTNIQEMILDSVHSNPTPYTKTKLITKIETNNKVKNYRTSICPYGIYCRKRLTCTYAHNQTQLRKPYKNRKNPCIRYQKGLCGLGAACPDYHGNIDLKKKNYRYKILPCKDWIEKGHCSKGNLCIYLHGQVDNDNNDEMIDDENIDNTFSLQTESKVNRIQKPLRQKQQQLIEKKEADGGENKKLMVGQIFKQLTKKTIGVKQTIEQKVKQNNHQNEQNVEDENFNIEFNL